MILHLQADHFRGLFWSEFQQWFRVGEFSAVFLLDLFGGRRSRGPMCKRREQEENKCHTSLHLVKRTTSLHIVVRGALALFVPSNQIRCVVRSQDESERDLGFRASWAARCAVFPSTRGLHFCRLSKVVVVGSSILGCFSVTTFDLSFFQIYLENVPQKKKTPFKRNDAEG